MTRFLYSIALIIFATLFVGILASLAWKFVAKSKCSEYVNSTALNVIDSLRECAKACWSKHGFGKDELSDDCFVVRVFIRDRNVTWDEVEGDFVIADFEKIVKEELVQLKIRYDASLRKVTISVFE